MTVYVFFPSIIFIRNISLRKENKYSYKIKINSTQYTWELIKTSSNYYLILDLDKSDVRPSHLAHEFEITDQQSKLSVTTHFNLSVFKKFKFR